MFSAFRASLHGFRDLFEHLFRYVGYSLLFWLCLGTILLAAPALLTLAWLVRPNRSPREGFPNWNEMIAYGKSNFVKSWKLTIGFIPLVLIFIFNIRFYSGQEDATSLLALLSAVGLLLIVLFLLFAVSHVAMTDSNAREGFIASGQAILDHLSDTILLGFLGFLMIIFSPVLVVPALLLFPPLITSMSDHFMVAAEGIPVFNPDAPTSERLQEAATEAKSGKRRRLRG